MLFKRLIQLPGTYVPAHVSLRAGNANVAQCILQVQKFLKYNQARAQLLQPLPLEGTLLQSKELCLGKSTPKKGTLISLVGGTIAGIAHLSQQ